MTQNLSQSQKLFDKRDSTTKLSGTLDRIRNDTGPLLPQITRASRFSNKKEYA